MNERILRCLKIENAETKAGFEQNLTKLYAELNSFTINKTEDEKFVTVDFMKTYRFILNKVTKVVHMQWTDAHPAYSVVDFEFFNKRFWKNFSSQVEYMMDTKGKISHITHYREGYEWMTDKQEACFNRYWKSIIQKRLKSKIGYLRKILFKEMIDRDGFKQTISVCGTKASLFHYNLIMANREEATRLLSVTPAVVSFWVECMAPKVILNSESLDFVYRKSIVEDCKNAFAERGLGANRYWKILCKLPVTCGYHIAHTFKHRPFSNVVPNNEQMRLSEFLRNVLDAIGTANTKIRPRLLSYICDDTEASDRMFPIVRTALFRAAFVAAAKKRNIKNWWNNEFSLVRDYANTIVRDGLNQQQLNAPWSWWMRRQVQWHIDARKDSKLRMRKEVWNSLVPAFNTKEYKVIPLTDTHALVDEGAEMHHCVGGYEHSCLDMKSRIFAIRGITNEEKATLEIRKNTEGMWNVAQVRGVYNAQVSKKIEALSGRVAQMYSVEWAKMPEKTIESEKGTSTIAREWENVVQEAVVA